MCDTDEGEERREERRGEEGWEGGRRRVGGGGWETGRELVVHLPGMQ